MAATTHERTNLLSHAYKKCYELCRNPGGLSKRHMNELEDGHFVLSDAEINVEDIEMVTRFLSSKQAHSLVKTLTLSRPDYRKGRGGRGKKTLVSVSHNQHNTQLKESSPFEYDGGKLFKAILHFISKARGLTTIEMDEMRLSEHELKGLGAALVRSKSTLLKLEFKKTHLEDEGLRILTPYLVKCHFRIISFECCNLTDASMRYISSLLKAQEAAMDTFFWNATLRLSDRDLVTDDGTSGVEDSISAFLNGDGDSHSDPEGLEESQTEIAYSVKAIESAVPGMQALNLKGNNISFKGILAVAKVLRLNQWVLGINFSDNKINKDGITHLAKALEGNTVLHTLVLSGNPGYKDEIGLILDAAADTAKNLAVVDNDVLILLKKWRNIKKGPFVAAVGLTGEKAGPISRPLKEHGHPTGQLSENLAALEPLNGSIAAGISLFEENNRDIDDNPDGDVSLPLASLSKRHAQTAQAAEIRVGVGEAHFEEEERENSVHSHDDDEDHADDEGGSGSVVHHDEHEDDDEARLRSGSEGNSTDNSTDVAAESSSELYEGDRASDSNYTSGRPYADTSDTLANAVPMMEVIPAGDPLVLSPSSILKEDHNGRPLSRMSVRPASLASLSGQLEMVEMRVAQRAPQHSLDQTHKQNTNKQLLVESNSHASFPRRHRSARQTSGQSQKKTTKKPSSTTKKSSLKIGGKGGNVSARQQERVSAGGRGGRGDDRDLSVLPHYMRPLRSDKKKGTGKEKISDASKQQRTARAGASASVRIATTSVRSATYFTATATRATRAGRAKVAGTGSRRIRMSSLSSPSRDRGFSQQGSASLNQSLDQNFSVSSLNHHEVTASTHNRLASSLDNNMSIQASVDLAQLSEDTQNLEMMNQLSSLVLDVTRNLEIVSNQVLRATEALSESVSDSAVIDQDARREQDGTRPSTAATHALAPLAHAQVLWTGLPSSSPRSPPTREPTQALQRARRAVHQMSSSSPSRSTLTRSLSPHRGAKNRTPPGSSSSQKAQKAAVKEAADDLFQAHMIPHLVHESLRSKLCELLSTDLFST